MKNLKHTSFLFVFLFLSTFALGKEKTLKINTTKGIELIQPIFWERGERVPEFINDIGNEKKQSDIIFDLSSISKPEKEEEPPIDLELVYLKIKTGQ